MIDLGTLQIGINVDNAKANKQLKQTSGAVDETGGKFSKFKGKALLAAAGVAAVGAVAIACGKKIKKLVDETAKYGDEIDKNSQKMGISYETYQKYDYMLQRSGSSIKSLKAGMKAFNSAIDGNSKAFEKLGINLENADGSLKSTDTLLNESMKSLAGVSDAHERLTLAQDLFGKRTAQELLPLLNQGSKGFDEMQKKMEELGFVMSDEMVKASADYEDAQLDLQMATTGLKNKIGAELLPIMTKSTEKMATFIGKISQYIDKLKGMSLADFIKDLGNKLSNGLSFLADGLDNLITNVTNYVIAHKTQITNSIFNMLVNVVKVVVTKVLPAVIKAV